MPRGFKVDRYETEKAYLEGRFVDKKRRSFISTTGHDLLAGDDKRARYREVMEAAKGFCQGCDKPHYVGGLGEWHHKKAGNVGRCDCLHNALWVCPEFHRKAHVQVRWSKHGDTEKA